MKNIKEYFVLLSGIENKGCKMLRKIFNFMCWCNIFLCLLVGIYWVIDYWFLRDCFFIFLFEKYYDWMGRENMDWGFK